MRKNFFAKLCVFVRNITALFMAVVMLFCIMPFTPISVGAEETLSFLPAYSYADGIDLSKVFAKGNGIYLGTFAHALKSENNNTRNTYERMPTPVLWEVNEDFTDIYSPVSLTSVYVLDTINNMNGEISAFLNSNPFFSKHESSIVESMSLLTKELLSTYYPAFGNDTSPRRATLKGSPEGIDWWLGDGHVDTENGIRTDSLNEYRGIRPHITINPANIVHASTVDGRTFQLTILDESVEPLELGELKTADEAANTVDEYTVLPVEGQYITLTADVNKTGSYSINYKIVKVVDYDDRTQDEVVGYRTGLGAVNETENKFTVNPVDFEGNRLPDGEYLVYVWLQQNDDDGAGLASAPSSFTINVESEEKQSSPVPEGNDNISDFGIVADYCNEVVRLVESDAGVVEVGDTLLAGEYKNKAVDFAANANNKPKYMYALKAQSTEGMSDKKLLQTLTSEKWYPIYGDAENGYTIDVSKILPKNGNKLYYIAIRRSDDIFLSDTGYQSRTLVQLKPRQSDTTFKKQIKYDPENELFYADSEINVMYRMNYFSKLMSATLTAKTDKVNNIKVDADKYIMGGVMYVSSLPIPDSNGGILYAASNPVKISIPKRLSMPSVKIDNSGKKLASLKKLTTEYCYDYDPDSDENEWIVYSSAATSIELSKLSKLQEVFPEIGLDSDGRNYVLYFRTKATAKAPASDVKTLLIPRSSINESE